jgi:hypothetical protein
LTEKEGKRRRADIFWISKEGKHGNKKQLQTTGNAI